MLSVLLNPELTPVTMFWIRERVVPQNARFCRTAMASSVIVQTMDFSPSS